MPNTALKHWLFLAFFISIIGLAVFFIFRGDIFHMRVDSTNPSSGAQVSKAARNDAFFNTYKRVSADQLKTLPGGLKVATLRPGDGSAAASGDRVQVHYTGWLENGQKFDSSVDRGEPIAFVLGAGQVISGWEKGIEGMQPGERRQLVIPASMAYGDRSAGPIPPGSTLVFNVELTSTQSASTNPKGDLHRVV